MHIGAMKLASGIVIGGGQATLVIGGIEHKS